jgi:hypothetical protein
LFEVGLRVRCGVAGAGREAGFLFDVSAAQVLS